MKGYYEGDLALKTVATTIFAFTVAFVLLIQIGNVSIVFDQQNTVDGITSQLNICNAELAEKCEPCPEVRCIGDLHIPLFIVGMFFGGIIGIALWSESNKRIIAELEKRGYMKKKEVKKDDKKQ